MGSPRQEEEEEKQKEITTPLLHAEPSASTSSSSTPPAAADDARREEEANSPIEQVALTVPVGDDPSVPVLTFRMWVLGTVSCALLSFLNQFFWYRKEPLSITSISAQIAVVPLGHLMARTITDRVFFKGTRWEFTLNPGPFNIKEHVLITIFANSGAGSVYAIHVVTAVKIFYRQHITFFVSLLVVLTTQVLGFGWAGIFRQHLVEPATMWWPYNLVQVSLFRALHEKEVRPKQGLTRNQFFMVAFVCSFAYYVFPGYLFSMLTSLSWICWIFPGSVLAQQLGSGLYGLGIGAIGLDWSTISSYLGSPLASPWFATANVAAGFVLIMYVITPTVYWLNLYKAKTFPIFSDGLFTSTGQSYNITSIIDSDFHLDVEAYEKEGPLYLSAFFAVTYGVGFASLTATVFHVLLFHGRALHEKEVRPKQGLTRNQFFMVAFVCSFAYYVFPGYLFSMLTSLSWICWIFPGSVLAQQLGSGLYGPGIGAIGLDWSTISSYLGSPLASPWFATANVAAGFVLIMYVITPTVYWLNLYKAKTFPIFSDGLFTSTGQSYNITSIIDSDFHLDVEAYEKEGPLYLSAFFAVTYGVGFASLTATVFHVLLFHGR
ncbi:hypothetical protein COCNU_scaffold021460G000020 [Cocos nucifera]|nr:hypothetical protein [Cocos nucifera]